MAPKAKTEPAKKKPIVDVVKDVKYDASMGLQLALMYMEFGFKACEGGHNLEAAREQFLQLMKKTLP